ncbi:MAG: archaellum operon transcriptional activator EarA family protein [Thermoplasmatota archaeon]
MDMHLHMHVIIHIRIVLLIVICIYFWDGMQEDKHSEMSIQRPLVIRALRRSNVRKKIVEYLFEISPSSSYTSEIAYNIKTTPTNVIGAIRGMGSRYKVEESLINLNIVEEKESGKNIKLYGLTPFGKEIIQSLKNNK